jgi:hypothetical protein
MNCWQSSGSEPTAAPLELELLELELLELELPELEPLELELLELELLELELLELELLELELLELELLELANGPAELEVVDDEDSEDAGRVPPLELVVVPLVLLLPPSEPVELPSGPLVPCDELPDESAARERPPLVVAEDALGDPGDPVLERIEVMDAFGPTGARKQPSPRRASNTKPSHAREVKRESSVRSAMPPPDRAS